MPALSPFQLANTLEAGLWFLLAAVFLFASRTRPAWPRPTIRLTVLTLIAFGFSDLVETQTNAWYRPWWLLVWKAACVAVLLYACIALYRAAKPRRAMTARTGADKDVRKTNKRRANHF